MNKKLSKHFIYNWLCEDTFGEYTLHKNTNNNFTKTLLSKLWQFFLIRKVLKRVQLVSTTFAPFLLEFSIMQVRSLTTGRKNISFEKLFYKSRTLLVKQGGLFAHYTFLKPLLLSAFKILPDTKITNLHRRPPLSKASVKTTYVVHLGNVNLLRRNKLRFLRRRGRFFFIRRKFSNKQRLLHIKGGFIDYKLNRAYNRFNKLKKYTKIRKLSFFSKKLNITRSPLPKGPTHRKFIRNWKISNKFNKQRRSSRRPLGSNVKLLKIFNSKKFKKYFKNNFSWRHRRKIRTLNGVIKNKLIRPLRRLLIILRNRTSIYKALLTSKKNLWRFYSGNKTTSAVVFNNLNLVVALKRSFWRVWNSSVFKLRGTYNWLLRGQKKNISKTKHNFLSPKFHFQGVFKKKNYVVKRHQKRQVLKFRLLLYFGMASNILEFYNIAKHYYSDKSLRVPSPLYLEFRIVTLMLRSGFFENGYTALSLLKRGVFLVNSTPVFNNVLTSVWDIMSISQEIWWFIYARFINFFSSVNVLKYLKGTRRLRFNSYFFSLKDFFISHNLLRKKNWKTGQIENKFLLTRFLTAKNYIFTAPPQYMEVSYRLLVFVVHRLILSTRELTQFTNFRGLIKLLPSNSNKAPLVRSNVAYKYPLAKLASTN